MAAATGYVTAQSEEHVLELLAEEHIDHGHACLHGDFDERVPLEAGGSADEAPTVDDTHVIWEATYQGEGYVVFDADAHFADGPFVFYTADGSVQAVEGTEIERGEVDDCDSLHEYVQIEPEEGQITLELIADSDDGDEPEDEDEDDHDGLVGELEIIDRETDEVVADTHDDHWHGDLPEIPVGDHISLGATFEDSDGEEIPLGEDEEYSLNATLADGGQEGIVTIDSHGDHLHLTGEDVGSTDIIFQLWHGDHADWESPPIAVEVIEAADDPEDEEDDHEDEDDHDHEHEDGETDLEVDVSVSPPDADRDTDARFHVTTRNHGDAAVETTVGLDVDGISKSATIEIGADDCRATWFCISHSDLSAGEHDWTVTADGETVTDTLTVPMIC